MKLSQLNIRKIKLKEIDKNYPGQDILMQSGQLYQYSAGIFGYGNVYLLMQKKIERIIEEELNKIGCIEVKLPTLQPSDMWIKSGRFDRYVNDGIMFVVDTEKGNYCLGPTAEEAVLEFSKNRLISYKNLPTIFYQIGDKYRNEIRTRGFTFRGKVFSMMDAYSFDQDEASLVKSYELVKQGYKNIFKRLGLNVIPVVADNGGMGGSKSEEYMIASEFGEDVILYDEVTNLGLNKEVLELKNYQQFLKDEYKINDVSTMKEIKAMELGHVFQLGTDYSSSMDATFTDLNQEQKPYYMGCYGIGVSRLTTLMIERAVLKNNDQIEGLSLPTEVAPYLIHIVYTESKKETAHHLYDILLTNNISTIIDDREDTLGSKIMDCKVLGTPNLVIIGDKTNEGYLELENTKTKEVKIITNEELIKLFKE